MANVDSPREFLTELLGIVDSMGLDKRIAETCEKDKNSYEKKLEELKKNIEREKTATLKSRREDIIVGFDRQIKSLNSELRSANGRRQRALAEGMEKKAKEATKDIRTENDGLKEALSAYAKSHKLPFFLCSRAYYALFCPKKIIYVLYIIMFLALIGLSGTMLSVSASNGESRLPWVIIGIADIALALIYVIIWNNTRVKYRDEIASCLNIVNSIKANEKNVKKIERTIKKAGEDDSYDLHEFDEEIAELSLKVKEAEEQKHAALDVFDNETAFTITEEIEKRHKEKISEISDAIAAEISKLNSVSERIAVQEKDINERFLPFIGAKNIDHDRIASMIKQIDEGKASTVTEAAAKIDEVNK